MTEVSVFVLVFDIFTPELIRICNDIFSRLPSISDDAVLSFLASLDLKRDVVYRSMMKKCAKIGKHAPFNAFSVFVAHFPYLRDFGPNRLTPFIDRVTTLDWSNKYLPLAIIFVYKLIYCDFARELAKVGENQENFNVFFETFVNFCVDDSGQEFEEKIGKILAGKMKKVIAWLSLSVSGNAIFKRIEGDLFNTNMTLEQKARRMTLYSDAKFAGLAGNDDWKILEWLKEQLVANEGNQAYFDTIADFMQNLLGQWLMANPHLRSSDIVVDIFRVTSRYDLSIRAYKLSLVCTRFCESESFGGELKGALRGQLWKILVETPASDAILKGIVVYLNGNDYVSEAQSLRGEITTSTGIVSNEMLGKIAKYVTDKISAFREDQRHLEIVFLQIGFLNMDICCEQLLPILIRRDVMCFCSEALGKCLKRWLSTEAGARKDLKEIAESACVSYCKRFVCSYDSVKQIIRQLPFEEDDIVLHFEQWRKAIGMDDYADWPFVKEGNEKLTVQGNTLSSLVPSFLAFAEHLAEYQEIIECMCSLVVSGTRDVSELASKVVCDITPSSHNAVIECLTSNIYKNYMLPVAVFTWTDTLISVLEICKAHELEINRNHMDRLIVISCICVCSPYMDLRVLSMKLIDVMRGSPFADMVLEKEKEISELALRNVLLTLSPFLKFEDHHFEVPLFRRVVSNAYTNLILFYLAALGKILASSEYGDLLSTSITSLNQGLAALVLPIRKELDEPLLKLLEDCFDKGPIIAAAITSCVSPEIANTLLSRHFTKQSELEVLVSLARLNDFSFPLPTIQAFCRNVDDFLCQSEVVNRDKAFSVDPALLCRFSKMVYNYCHTCVHIFESLITYQDVFSCYDRRPVPVVNASEISSFAIWSSLAAYEPDSESASFEAHRLSVITKQAFVKFLYVRGVPKAHEKAFLENVRKIGRHVPQLMTYLFFRYFEPSLLKQARRDPLMFYGFASTFGDATTYVDRCLKKDVSESVFSREVFEAFPKILSICFQYMLSDSMQERNLAFNLMLSSLFTTCLFFFPYEKVKAFVLDIKAEFQSGILKERILDLSEKLYHFIPFYAEQFVRECFVYGKRSFTCKSERNLWIAQSMLKAASVWIHFASPVRLTGIGIFEGCLENFSCLSFAKFFGMIMDVDPEIQLCMPLLEIFDVILSDSDLANMLLAYVFELRVATSNAIRVISYALTVREDEVLNGIRKLVSIEHFNYLCVMKGYSEWQKVHAFVEELGSQGHLCENNEILQFLSVATNKRLVNVDKKYLLQWCLCCGDLTIATRAAEMLRECNLDEKELMGVLKALFIVSDAISSSETALDLEEVIVVRRYITCLIELAAHYSAVDEQLWSILPAYCECNQVMIVKAAISALLEIMERTPSVLECETNLLSRVNFDCFDKEILSLFFGILKAAAKSCVSFLGSEFVYSLMILPLVWENKNELLSHLKSKISEQTHDGLQELLDGKTDAKVAFQRFYNIGIHKLKEDECLTVMSYLVAVVERGNSLHASAAYYIATLMIQNHLIPLESALIARMFQTAVSCSEPILVDPIHFFLETVVLTNQGMVFKFAPREIDSNKFPVVSSWCGDCTNELISFENVEKYPCVVLVSGTLTEVSSQKMLRDQLRKYPFEAASFSVDESVCKDEKCLFDIDTFKRNLGNT